MLHEDDTTYAHLAYRDLFTSALFLTFFVKYVEYLVVEALAKFPTCLFLNSVSPRMRSSASRKSDEK